MADVAACMTLVLVMNLHRPTQTKLSAQADMLPNFVSETATKHNNMRFCKNKKDNLHKTV